MSRPYRLVAGIVAAVLLGITVATAAPEPFEIPVILPMSGFAAFAGQNTANTLHIIEDVVNKQGGIRGRAVRFVIQDDQSSPQVAVQLTNGIAANKVPVMMGSVLSSMCLAQAPVVRDGPVLWCFSPVPHPPSGSYMFVTSETTEDFIEACVRYARGRGWKRLATFSTTDASGADFDEGINRVLAQPENRDVAVVDREHFNVADLSAAAQMARVKNVAPDAVFGWVTGTALGTLLHAGADAGVDLPMFTTPANMMFTQLRNLSSVMPSTLLFPGTGAYAPDQLRPGPMKQAVLRFRDALRANGLKPDTGTLLTWDAPFIIVDALRKLGTDVSAGQLRAYLAAYKGAGASGLYDFVAHPQRGLDASTGIIVQWDKAREDVHSVSTFGGVPLRSK